MVEESVRARVHKQNAMQVDEPWKCRTLCAKQTQGKYVPCGGGEDTYSHGLFGKPLSDELLLLLPSNISCFVGYKNATISSTVVATNE